MNNRLTYLLLTAAFTVIITLIGVVYSFNCKSLENLDSRQTVISDAQYDFKAELKLIDYKLAQIQNEVNLMKTDIKEILGEIKNTGGNK